MTVVWPEAFRPASSTADFTCGDAGQRAAAQHQRQPAALAAHIGRAHLAERPQHPHHRPSAQAGVAGEADSDRIAGDRAHHQPHAGAGVAAIDDVGGLDQAPPPPLDPPGALAPPFDGRAQRPHRLGGVEDVVALEQA
jgi:hypothetical protein